MEILRYLILPVFCILFRLSLVNGVYKFPNDFLFGAGTSAYQVEGAISTADKGESILDRMTTRESEFFRRSRGDVSADSYHYFKKDIEILHDLKVNVYHFSISWSRLLPTGFSNAVSRDGIRYYHNLIDGLLAKNITPHITLYHWDLPQKLQEIGGWSNPVMIDNFVDYAKLVFGEFGKKVKTWITFDDVSVICNRGNRVYLKQYLPSEGVSGVTEYLCTQNILMAHAKTWMMYRTMYKPEQKGRVGISFAAPWVEPLRNTTRDLEIANLAMEFLFDRYVQPIFSQSGNYPPGFIFAVANRSARQGYPTSRLPSMSEADISILRGSSDFLGISVLEHTVLAFKELPGQRPHYQEPSIEDDLGFFYVDSDELENTKKSFNIHSSYIYNILMRIKEKYNNTEVLITGNGIGTLPGLVDLPRVFYIENSLMDVGRALRDGCNVTSYVYWTLMDGFQWVDGYRVRNGLYEVDFKSAQKTRTPRISSLVYKNIIETRIVDPLYSPSIPKSMLSGGNSNKHTMGSLLFTLFSFVSWFCWTL